MCFHKFAIGLNGIHSLANQFELIDNFLSVISLLEDNLLAFIALRTISVLALSTTFRFFSITLQRRASWCL